MVYGWIPRDDWLASVQRTGAAHGDVQPEEGGWVVLNRQRDAYALGAEFVHGVPFCDANGVWRTIHDEAPNNALGNGFEVLGFYGLRFSSAALHAAIALGREEEPKDEGMDVFERRMAHLWLADDVLTFSEQVCRWGGRTGFRVWGNMLRHAREMGDTGGTKLALALRQWLAQAEEVETSPSAAISAGIAIKGLGVSYASKHLRLLWPERYPVLDSLVCDVVGVAMNTQGYQLFCDLLIDWRARHTDFHCYGLGDLEFGLFRFVRHRGALQMPARMGLGSDSVGMVRAASS